MATLEAALDYARLGWRVVPILAGSKRPALTRWTEHASTDEATIKGWWDGHDDYGVGIATGPSSGFWALDVDDFDSLLDLEQRYEVLPDTRTSITGSGGYHFLFRWPDDGRDIRNDAGRRLGPGLDIRGDGGQIVAPPTIHPNGIAYQWDAGTGDDIADAPAWLLDLVCETPAEATPPTAPSVPTGDRPGDLWATATPWAELLGRDGWELHHVGRDGEHHWTRPGKDRREGTSATTGYKGSDVLKVFTSSMRAAGLDEEQTYTKLGYLAATRFDGDHSAAAAALVAAGWGDTRDDPFDTEAFRTSVEALARRTLEDLPDIADTEGTDDGQWQFIDLGPILDGSWEPPRPTLLTRDDGVGLVYPGRVHSLAGEPGGGKTWVALHLAAAVISNGGTAMLIDYEDQPGSAVSRLLALGVAPDAIRERFTYVRPDGPLIDRQGRVAGHTMARLEAIGADVVIIDSIGESLAAEGLKPNDDDAVARWFRLLPRRLARAGSAVLGVDHQAKSKDDRGLWAIGSQRKLAAIDGAAYIAEVKVAPTKTKDGHLRIVCAKDRHGTHQRGHTVADVHICTTDDGIGVAVVAPAETFRPTGLMEKVSRFLEETPTASTRHILAGVAGKDRHIRTALDVLLAEGFVRSERGGHGGQQWSSREPFRDPANPENATAAPRPHRGPESGPRLELDSEALRPHINRARPPRPTAAPPAGRGDRGPTAAPPEQNATKDHETSHRSTAAPRPHRGPASGPRSDGRPRPRGPDPLRSRGPAGQQSSLARDETGNDSQTTAAPTSDVPISADPIDPIDDGPCDPFAPLDGQELL